MSEALEREVFELRGQIRELEAELARVSAERHGERAAMVRDVPRSWVPEEQREVLARARERARRAAHAMTDPGFVDARPATVDMSFHDITL